MSEDVKITDEMVGTGVEEMDMTPQKDTPNTEVKDERVWTLKDGSECSKSAFIREQFTEENKTRKEISEEFDIPYRTVYGATINMENDAEPANGRSASKKVLVDEEGNSYRKENGKVYCGATEIEESDFELIKEDLKEVDRNDFIRDQMEAGKTRGAIAEDLGVSYGVVYAATKDLGGTRQQHMVEYEGKEIPRNEYIKLRFAEGVSKADIAKELEVDYAVVWNATKKEKTVQEKFSDAVKKLAKFESNLSTDDVENFKDILTVLDSIVIPEADKETN